MAVFTDQCYVEKRYIRDKIKTDGSSNGWQLKNSLAAKSSLNNEVYTFLYTYLLAILHSVQQGVNQIKRFHSNNLYTRNQVNKAKFL